MSCYHIVIDNVKVMKIRGAPPSFVCVSVHIRKCVSDENNPLTCGTGTIRPDYRFVAKAASTLCRLRACHLR